MKIRALYFTTLLLFFFSACKKNNSVPVTPVNPAPSSFSCSSLKVNGAYNGYTYNGINTKPVIVLSFSAPLDKNRVTASVSLTTISGSSITYSATYQNNDSTIIIQPSSPLSYLTKYTLNVSTALKSASGGSLQSAVMVSLLTAIDSSDKFSRISDSALLTLIQQQTFKYFWDLANPVSGMAQERTSSGNTCATGGTGFGIMGMLAAVNRNFISRTDALSRIQKIVSFLKNNCPTYHGAFSHWINGTTGATIPFSTYDDGGDIVETSYMMMGLLCARQYFNQNNAAEDTLRSNINALWNAVDWTWYQNNQNALYWNWSPDNNWAINVKVQGWDEALITYVLAASSNNHAIDKAVYDNGWAQNGAMKNGNTFYNITLPLGPNLGGPLFFEQYSFMGIDPNGLSDVYADYAMQTKNHTLINYSFCVANPNNYYGYSDQCWGLTASDISGGYNASSPTNDAGVIAPTAAISSLPYTPAESMNAIRFFYYKLGDKIWGQYGFYDAFNLTNPWVDTDCLAIDQGPEIVMIENYRSGLLWNLFMSCPEVKSGLQKLGFTF